MLLGPVVTPTPSWSTHPGGQPVQELADISGGKQRLLLAMGVLGHTEQVSGCNVDFNCEYLLGSVSQPPMEAIVMHQVFVLSQKYLLTPKFSSLCVYHLSGIPSINFF